MTREELTKILDEAKSMNQGNEDFAIEIDPKDMRSALARLRHMVTKDIIDDFDKLDDRRIEIIGYTG